MASAILHAALIALLRAPSVEQFSSAVPLEVRLIAFTERKLDTQPPLPAKQKIVKARGFAETPVGPIRPVAALPDAPAPPNNITSATSDKLSSPPAPGISLDALLNSARRIAREEVRRQPTASQENSSDNDRPVLAQLARAFQRDAPGETRLARGMIKVVTASGAIYCLQAPPEFARGGLGEPTIVPTNCPR